MINLIPEKAKKEVTKEYWVRVLTVFLFILSSVIAVTVFLMLPVYVLVNAKVNAYSSSAVEATEKVAEYDLSAKALVKANDQAQMVIGLREIKSFSEIIELIESLKSEDVIITRYEFNRQGLQLDPMTLGGKALTRQGLLNFKETLLSQSEISNVDLPISNLAKDKDIPFSITVTFESNEN